MGLTWPSIISMARKSNKPARRASLAILLGLAFFASASRAGACPFCTALKPTLAQQRAAARVTALVELEQAAAGGPATVKLHQAITGGDVLQKRERLTIPLDLSAEPGTLLVIFGRGDAEGSPEALDWHAVAVDEVAYAYLARSPALEIAAAERLAYFARYLEHANPLVAEDAYLEFGHAPFDVVAESAELLPMDKVRRWLTDPAVPASRKGFYGLALGLARDAADREQNAALLREQIVTPDDDFRSGFDGILGGYLLLSGVPGLELIEASYLADPKAAVGDVRHAMTALRFYHECGRQIPTDRLSAAMRHLLARPEFAEAAIIDLARWQDWTAMDQIAGLYSSEAYAQPATRRAIVGYLTACPKDDAARALRELRELDPQGIAAAEAALNTLGGVRQ